MKTVSLSSDDIYAGNLILVNQKYPYTETHADIRLTSVGTSDHYVLLERQYAAIYTKLMDELNAWGQIMAMSGWRSRREQEQIYNESLSENGADFTGKYVALPEHSEHQTGLAVDLALNKADIDVLRPYFPYEGICGAFRKKAGQYGFIERYPKGKESITGIAYEPWHFRYVGAPHAMIMNRTGETLEEYLVRLKQFDYGRRPLEYDLGASTIEISYLVADEETTAFEMEDDAIYMASGNNMDGFIITVWRERR